MKSSTSKAEVSPQKNSSTAARKRKRDDVVEDIIEDDVRFWEDGYKERYYSSKFAVSTVDDNFRSKVACEYVTGLCWILQYYFQVI